jgi:hypothetical protein
MERERLLIDTPLLIDHLRKTPKDKAVFYLLASPNAIELTCPDISLK